MPLRRAQLLAASFPHATRAIELYETHLSHIVLTGEYAYKIKKAIKLDFIDTSSLERRRRLCEEELRLNRRFAPDLYLDVVAITADASGRLSFAGTGTPVEYAVRMRQFDPSLALDALVDAAAVTTQELVSLADRIAHFHRHAAKPDATLDTARDVFARNARSNFDTLNKLATEPSLEAKVARLRAWTETVLVAQRELLAERTRKDRVRECHGDLHCGNVVRWQGELVPFDALEFDPTLRFIDVLNDTAFLTMDLSARRQTDLAFAFLNRYLERTGDYLGVGLLPAYLVYRALVRAKVELIAYSQHRHDDSARQRAHRYIELALHVADRPQPLLVVMHGASGSGKSWLSEQLVSALPALRIRSDLERKRLAGLDPFDTATRGSQDIYTLEFNEHTYAHLLECARACLQAGLNVIVDAAFLRAAERTRFQELARVLGATYRLVSCRADPDTLARRIAARRVAGTDPSDADEAVMRRQLATMDAFDADELPHLIEIDTRAEDAVARVLKALTDSTARF